MPAKPVKKVRQVQACRAADLLGREVAPREQPAVCFVCQVTLTPERREALRSMGTPETRWACVTHSTTRRVLGQYLGEAGTSQMKLCDRVDENSVRSVFRKSTLETEEGEQEAGEREPD